MVILHCFPVAVAMRDEKEKGAIRFADKPFFFPTVGVPDVNNYIEVSLPYRLSISDPVENRTYLYKVMRITWTSKEIKVMVIEDR